jgi:hypothetical protein
MHVTISLSELPRLSSMTKLLGFFTARRVNNFVMYLTSTPLKYYQMYRFLVLNKRDCCVRSAAHSLKSAELETAFSRTP